jgi:hypothetical protein
MGVVASILEVATDISIIICVSTFVAGALAALGIILYEVVRRLS